MKTTKKGAWLSHPDIPLLRTLYRGDVPFEELTSQGYIKVKCVNVNCQNTKTMTLGNWLQAAHRRCSDCRHYAHKVKPGDTTKNCTKCKKDKPLDQFKSTQAKFGISYASRCYDCAKQYSTEMYYSTRQKDPLRGWLNSAFVASRIRARQLGTIFTITRDDIIAMWPEGCMYCGKKLEFNHTRGDLNSGPSMDKIIPAAGYTKENVAITCLKCNVLKRDGTLEELEALVAGLRRVIAERGKKQR